MLLWSLAKSRSPLVAQSVCVCIGPSAHLLPQPHPLFVFPHSLATCRNHHQVLLIVFPMYASAFSLFSWTLEDEWGLCLKLMPH